MSEEAKTEMLSAAASFKTIYEFEGTTQKLLVNEADGTFYLQKELTHYDLDIIRFLQEYRHPNLVHIVDFREEGDHLVTIEEYINGQTVQARLDRHDLTRTEKKQILYAVCDGLSFLHEATPPVIHRDIKPSNIMIYGDGFVKIIDFNTLKTYKPDELRDTVLLGTAGIAAPEQYGFAQSDERTDIFAVGKLIEELFPGERRFRNIIDKSQRWDPNQRFQNMQAMRRALERVIPPDEPDKVEFKPFPLPGFRSHTDWKMLIASLGYAFIFLYGYFFIEAETPGASLAQLWYLRVEFWIFWLLVVDIFTCYTGLFQSLPLMKSPSFIPRLIGKAIAMILLLMATFILEKSLEFFWPDFFKIIGS